jgi:hypothetical protein
MKQILCFTLLALTSVSRQFQNLDDFSAGGWLQCTPGTMTVEQGKLFLKDAPGELTWVTARKSFTVDVDRTPLFVVKVVDVSRVGTIKLIRQHPFEKRVALEIDRPGLYTVDMRERFRWKGRIAIETCLYAIGDEAEVTYAYVRFAEKLTTGEEKEVTERAGRGHAPLFEVFPLFNTCGVYFRSPERVGLSMAYRTPGGEWLPAFPPAYFPEDRMYRGSIVDLSEDTAYELKVSGEKGEVLAQKEFRTWRTAVPIAKTIVLDETNFAGHLKVKKSGTADGWIKITAKPGFILRNERAGPLIQLSWKRYILLEGLTLRGGLNEAISIKHCQHVRVVNCDIAGWGRIWTHRLDTDGKFSPEGSGDPINRDSAILVSRSLGTVVERCYIHDPVSTANSWYYAHPGGPQAVFVDRPWSTVVRYNDFIGSDEHRWGDAIEGSHNFRINGGFNRDADIYGNMICFANDDSLEIDGGQINVRVFDNKLEGCLCGVSIQGCMSSPSYVFRNLMVNMWDERGLAGQTIKTSSHTNGPSAVSFILGNTCCGKSDDLFLRRNLRIMALNNIFAGRRAIRGRAGSPQSVCDYNLLSTGEPTDEKHGIIDKPGLVDPASGLFTLRTSSAAVGKAIPIANFAPGANGRVDMGAIPLGSDRVLPYRPVPIYLDRYQLVFSVEETKARRAKTVSVSVKGQGFSSPYRIAKNSAFDWFTATPRNGVVETGKALTFTVTMHPERMTERATYKGAFLVRLANGYSRPVMVYGKTDFVPVVRPSRDGVWVSYLEAEAPSGGRAYGAIDDAAASGGKAILLAGDAGKDPAEYRFGVPKDGVYFVLLRVRSSEPAGAHDSLFFAMDGRELKRSRLRSTTSWGWSMAAQNRQMPLICLQPRKLKAGEHVLRIAPHESIYLDLIGITDNPKMFE